MATITGVFGSAVAILIQILKSAVSHFVSMLLKIIFVTSVLVVISPLLPSDPFRSQIVNLGSAFSGFAVLISWCIPVTYLVNLALFSFACKSFFYVYKVLASSFNAPVFSGSSDDNISGYLE